MNSRFRFNSESTQESPLLGNSKIKYLEKLAKNSADFSKGTFPESVI